VQPSAQLIDFRLDNEVPVNVVGKVPVLPELVVLFEKFLAVRERLLVVSNDLS
jgi:hypothetical protein